MARFDCAIWRPVVNHGGAMSSDPRSCCCTTPLPTARYFDHFNNPASEVSATFWVSKTGVIEQYTDSNTVAWHARQLNGTYCGVETEGCTQGPDYAEAMTSAMVATLGTLYAEGMRRHGWPAQLCEAAGQRGLGYHRMPGGVNTACPCDVRLARRPDILAAATGTAPGPAPAKRKGRNMIAKTDTGDGYWTTTDDGAIYAFGDAENKGSPYDNVGDDRIQPGQSVVGIEGHGNDGYWLLISDGSVFAYGSAPYKGRPDRT